MLPNAPLREGLIEYIYQNPIMVANLKTPSLSRHPTDLILTRSSQRYSIDNFHKLKKDPNSLELLARISYPNKEHHCGASQDQPHKPPCYYRFRITLENTNSRAIPPPNIKPKFHSRSITNLKLNIARKGRPTTSNSLP